MAISPTPDVPTPLSLGLINKGQDQQDPFGDLRPRTPDSRLSSAPLSSGGPDGFGYTWDDTVASGWVDATAGTQVNFPGTGSGWDDAFSDPVGIGFDFDFYENDYQQLYPSVSGLLTFGAGSSSLSNVSIPQNASLNNFIAPFWDDLVVGGSFNDGAIYTLNGGSEPNRYLIVEWHEVTRLGSDDLLTFQAALHENGDIIVFRFGELNGVLDKATVGIEDGDGVVGLNHLHNSVGLSQGEAALFRGPGPSARGKFLSKYQGGLAINNRFTAEVNEWFSGSLLAWTNSTNDGIAYVVLDKNSFAVLAGPTNLPNPNSRQADYVSLTSDAAGRGNLTWMDSGWSNYLYYALIDEDGKQLTPPVVFHNQENPGEAVFTNYAGQGNVPYEGTWFIHLPLVMR